MATLTYNDKQIRKYKKKARQNEQKFSKTKDKLFLWKADELLTKANKLSENETVEFRESRLLNLIDGVIM